MEESDNDENAGYITQIPLTSLTKPQIKGIAEYLNKYKMANRKNNNRKSKMRKWVSSIESEWFIFNVEYVRKHCFRIKCNNVVNVIQWII